MVMNHFLALKTSRQINNRCCLFKQRFLAGTKLFAVWDTAVLLAWKDACSYGTESCIISGRWQGRLHSPHTPSMHFAGQFLIFQSLKCLLLSECLNKLPNPLSVSHCWHLLLVLAINQFILSWSNPTVLLSQCRMAQEGSFLFIRFLLKTTVESRVSVLRWWKQLGIVFFFQHTMQQVFYVHSSCGEWPWFFSSFHRCKRGVFLMELPCCEAGVSERKIMPLLKRMGKVKVFGSMLEIAASVGTWGIFCVNPDSRAVGSRTKFK